TQTSGECGGRLPAGGRHEGLGIDGAEAGDVVGDGAVEEFDVLGDVADPGAEVLAGPVGDVGAVATDGAGRGGPDTGQQPRQRGLAGGGGAEDGQGLPRDHGEGDVGEDGLLGAADAEGDAVGDEAALGGGQGDPRGAAVEFFRELPQAVVGAASV